MPAKEASIRVALIGCGAVARLYYMPALRALVSAGSLEVVALLDPVAGHADPLREAFPRARMAHQLSDLPPRGFDLAIVASPHSLHAAQSIQLMEAGVSVLCEKPMATSVDDAKAMIQAASVSRGQLAIGLVRRFFPASRMIRHILALGTLGDITSFDFSEGSASFGWPAASRGYFDKREAQGGVLMDIGVHALDLLQWWLGQTAVVEYADDAMGGIEANCLIRCRLECGAAGEVRLSRDCALANRYTVRGRRGWLSWQAGQVDQFDLGFADSPQIIQAGLRDQSASNFEQSFLAQLRNVIAALRGTEELLVPAKEGIAGIELIENCYRQLFAHGAALARRSRNRARPGAQWRKNGGSRRPVTHRVAILGASGFIGSRIVEMFHLGGLADVRPVTRSIGALARLARFDLDWRLADARDQEGMCKALADCETVIHAIAGGPATIRDSVTPVYRAAQEAGVRRLVYLSSASVHGQAPPPGTDDESPLRRRQPIAYNNARCGQSAGSWACAPGARLSS